MPRFKFLIAMLVALAWCGAASGAEQRYVVTLKASSSAIDAKSVAEELAADYGARLADESANAGEAFVLRLSPSRVRLVAADPRVASVAPVTSSPVPNAVETVSWTGGVSYEYDQSGNVKKVGRDAYGYDQAGRLVQAEVNAVKTYYEYDGFGNRTKCTQAGGDCQFGITINATENKNRLRDAGYDAAGNVTSLFGHAYSYDAVNMIKREQGGGVTREYIYTADEERIATHTLGVDSWHWTVREPSGKVMRELESHGSDGTASWRWIKDYVWRGGALLATRQRDGSKTTTYHYHVDHLGTPRRIGDERDNTIGVHDYYAYGPEVSGGTNEPSVTAMKFTGHERDMTAEAFGGLDYMHARYYAPALGRFLSVDPYLDVEKSMHTPQMWNRYAYVTNNPLRYTDPTGKSLWETLFRVVRYIGRNEKVVARVKAISKSKAMEGIDRGIQVARKEKATSIAVVTETKEARNAVGKQLSESGKIRPPERSGIWPEHVNPADGPNADIHVQTVDATKNAGFGKALGAGILAIIGANTMAANANQDATPGEITSAFIWDTAKAIDPIFLTDVIEHVTGVNGYAEENPPE